MSVATEPGFTAVNGRSPPTWSERFQPSNNPAPPMESNMFTNHRPEQAPHFSTDDSESRKRKRDEGADSSPHSNSSQRPRHTSSTTQAPNPTLPPIPNGQQNGGPYTSQEPHAQGQQPTHTSTNGSAQWHTPRPSMDSQMTDSRALDPFEGAGQPQSQVNGNYGAPTANGNVPDQGYPTPNGAPDQQQDDQDDQSPSQPMQTLPGMAAPRVEKQRKRNFANRTKTGCLTCRNRKKKCDEGKPICNNCQRGGFECKGYSQTHQLRAGASQPPLFQKPDAGPFAVHGTAAYTTAPFPHNAVFYPPPPDGIDHTRGPLPPRDDPTRGFIDPTLPPSYSRPFQDPHMAPFHSEPMRPDYGHPAPTMPDFGREKKQLPPMTIGSSIGPSAPYTRSSPQDMAALALSNPSSRTEKDKMVNQSPFDPTSPALRIERTTCAKFLYAFNRGCEDPDNLKPHEKRDRFRAIIDGQDPNSTSPRNGGDLRGGAIGANTDIQAPFYCDYGFNIKIGDNTDIGRNCAMHDACTVKIGRNCIIGPDVKFLTQKFDETAKPPSMPQGSLKRLAIAHPITVEDGACIGAGCTILPGVKIAKDAIIQAGTIVDKEVRAAVIVERDSHMRTPNGPWNNLPPHHLPHIR